MKKPIFISFIIIIINLPLLAVSVELYNGNIINGDIEYINKDKLYLENMLQKKLIIIEKSYIKLIDNDSLKTRNLLQNKYGEFPNYNSYLEIEKIKTNFQYYYNFTKLNPEQSAFLGQYEADTKHKIWEWKLTGFVCGAITPLVGNAIVILFAHISNPKPKTIPINADASFCQKAYSNRARLRNINSSIVFGIIGTTFLAFAYIILLSIAYSGVSIG